MPTTSIYMSSETRDAVSRAASRMGRPQRDIVVMLLMRMMDDAPMLKSAFDTVKYQPDDPGGGWHTFCIKFKGDEYEFFTDMRKHCKSTVSLLLAMAVKRHLAKIIGDDEHIIFNYFPYHAYLVGHGSTGGVFCWISCWGKVRKQEITFPSPLKNYLLPGESPGTQ